MGSPGDLDPGPSDQRLYRAGQAALIFGYHCRCGALGGGLCDLLSAAAGAGAGTDPPVIPLV